MTHSPNPAMVLGISVISELGTATQLLATGLNELVGENWISREPASAFTCLASGVERVMKLTYGFDTLKSGGSFPNDDELRKLGHDLVRLNDVVVPSLIASAANAGKDYVRRLLEDAKSDPYWPEVLGALNAWAATSGRYRDLTILTGKPVSGDPPWALWAEVERRCFEDLGLMNALAGPKNHAALVMGRRRLAQSILKWWFALYRSWLNGLVGDDKKSPGALLSPADTRQLSAPLARLVKGW